MLWMLIHTNEIFPFNDHVNRKPSWWEEGKVTQTIIETAKTTIGGEVCHVAIKEGSGENGRDI